MESDLISRIGLLEDLGASCYDLDALTGVTGDERTLQEAIMQYPASDAVQVVHGHWVHCKGRSNLWYCSECGDKMLYNPTRRTYNIVKLSMAEKNKFCRNCGARMDGESEEGTDGNQTD